MAVAPGIVWLRMPLPFALDHINLWLLEDGAAWTAVDTGFAATPVKDAWQSVIADTAARAACWSPISIRTTSVSPPGCRSRPARRCG